MVKMLELATGVLPSDANGMVIPQVLGSLMTLVAVLDLVGLGVQESQGVSVPVQADYVSSGLKVATLVRHHANLLNQPQH